MQSFFATSGLINAVIAILFGIFVIVKNSRKTVNRLCFLLISATAIWSFSYWRWLLVYDNEATALFWVRLLSLGSTFIPLFYFHWIITLLEVKKKKLVLFFYALTFFYISFLFSNLFVSSVEPKLKFVFWPNPGPIYNFYLLTHYFGLVIYAIYLLIINYQKVSGIKKQQIKYVLIGSLIGLGGGATNFLLWHNIGIPPVGNFLVSFYVVFFTYAIVRYRLMDIRIVIIRSIVYFLLILYVAGLYAFLSSVASRILIETTGASSAFVPLVIAFIIVIGLEPIKKILARYTDRLFYKDRIDYQGVLRSLSEVVAREIDLTELVDSILQVLVKQLKVKSGLVLVADKQGRFFKLESYLNSRKNVVLGSKNHLIKHLKEKPDIIITEELVRMIEDVKTKREKNRLERVRKELDLLDCGLCIPVIIEEELTAVMIIGPKLSGDMFSVEDIRLFEVLSPQMAAALEKAKLYQEVQDFTKTLQQKVAQATRELQRANARLKQLDEAKSEFLSIATHQLRTPLTAIKGYLAMLTEGDYGRLQPEQQKAALTVFTSADRLNRLVNVFLNVSRIEAGRLKIEKKEVLLEELARKVVENFRQEAESKGLSLEFIKPKWPSKKIRADSDKLTDVANNLVDNAIKYTSYGKIEVRVYEKDNQIFFSVKDTGMGIRKPDLAELFNKFKRTDRSEGINTRGAGLGLFIAKKLVEAHGGKIWAESKGEGQGSMFVFSLPLV